MRVALCLGSTRGTRGIDVKNGKGRKELCRGVCVKHAMNKVGRDGIQAAWKNICVRQVKAVDMVE